MTPGSRLISVSIAAADGHTAKALAVSVGTELVRIVRLRLADKRPVLINDLCLLREDCPGLETHSELAADQASVYEIVTRDYGLRIAEMKGFIQPVLADKQETEYLEIAPGSPIFRTEVVGANPEGRPLVYAVDLVRGDWGYDISSS